MVTEFDKDKERIPFVGNTGVRLDQYGSIIGMMEDEYFYPSDETD